MPLYQNKYRTESNRLKNWDYSNKAIYFITLVTQNRKCIFGDIENEKMILNDKGKIIETELRKSIQIRDRWHFHNWVIMPNHIHLLIEIVETPLEMQNVETHCSASLPSQIQKQQSKFLKSGYSTETILPTDTDIELAKLFISYEAYLSYIKSNGISSSVVETHCSASEPNVDIQNIDIHPVETHSSASLQSNDATKSNLFFRKPKSISSFVAVFKSITTKQINPLLGNDETDSIWQSNYHDHIVQNYDSFDKIYYYIKNNPKNWDTDSINS